MIIIIGGTTHSGKTLLSQKLLEKIKYPYLSIDHIKMGLIRSNYTNLTPEDDDKLTEYLWPIIKEIIKTNIENNQNIIIEGCYIPFNFLNDFDLKYLENIKHVFLILSQKYIQNNFDLIKKYSSVIENRIDDSYLNKNDLIFENVKLLNKCVENNLDYVLIEDNYIETIDDLLEKIIVK